MNTPASTPPPSTQAPAPTAMAASDFALDNAQRSLGDVWNDTKGRLKSGNLGAIPALLSIFVLGAIFTYAKGSVFLGAPNFANLLDQSSSVIVIAMAVSFALLLGEIDLAAGFTAGVSAAVLATRLQDWPLGWSILASAVVAAVLGTFTGFMVARVGIPSFVVTLANVLLFQGILLLLVKEGGSVRIDNRFVNGLVGNSMTPTLSWIFTLLVLALFALSLVRRQRSSHGAIPMSLVGLKLATAVVVGVFVTIVLNRNRAPVRARENGVVISGMPIVVPAIAVLLLVLTFLLTRTRYGRHLYAVGGNAEAARRAGINVTRIRLSAFVMCGLLAGIGGAFLASRVNSVDPNTGANDTLLLAVGAAVIGGTSLFGGQGRMLNAVLGGVVLALIPNGLSLVGKRSPFGTEIDFGSSGVKFMCAGAALLLASSVDALSRKRTG